MLELYFKEKESHQKTKKNLKKALKLSQFLLNEIDKFEEIKQNLWNAIIDIKNQTINYEQSEPILVDKSIHDHNIQK